MAVNLKNFQTPVEKRLPIVFLLDESGDSVSIGETPLVLNGILSKTDVEKNTTSVPSMNYVASFVEQILQNCADKNIRAEVSIVSYGSSLNFRYPILKDDQAPYFKANEKVAVEEVCEIIRRVPKANQSVLGSAMALCKAILDDTETVLTDRYKPVVVVVSTKKPMTGWQSQLDSLLNDGRSANCQMYWVNIGTDNIELDKRIQQKKCTMDSGKYWAIEYSYEDYFLSSWNDVRSFEEVSVLFKNSLSHLGFLLTGKNEPFGVGILANALFVDGSGEKLSLSEEQLKNLDRCIKKRTNGTILKIEDVLGCQFKNTQGSNCKKNKENECFYIDERTSKFNGAEIAREIVNSFKFEPLEEVPDVKPVFFSMPTIDGSIGDGVDAKGDGVV